MLDPIRLRCPDCGVNWDVDRALAGYKLRCRCGVFVPVPAPPRPLVLKGSNPAEIAGSLPAEAAPTAAARWRPAPSDEKSSLSTPPPEARVLNRAIGEIVLLVGAFLVPGLLVWLLVPDDRSALAMPFLGMASGIIVLLVGGVSGAFDGAALHVPRLRDLAEAVLAATAFFFAALLLEAGVRRLLPEAESDLGEITKILGLPAALFSIAFCPGVFEELAFRGVVQGRMLLLFGRPGHLHLTAVAFALAHGVTAALPIHFGIGLYLCLLRERTGSLWPGMLLHMLYNGALVVRAGAS